MLSFTLLDRKRSSHKCSNSICQVYSTIEEIDTLTRTITGESFKINHHLCCNDKCLGYLLTHKIWNKQKTAKRVDRFRLWRNDCKECERKFFWGEEIKQKSLNEHFLRDGHQSFEEDVSLCLIDKTDPFDPYKREYYWMKTLQTVIPFGLDTEEL